MIERLLRLAALALATAAVLTPTARAAGELVPAGGGAPLEVVREEVRATVRDGLATTRVVEVFRNVSSRPLEAVYAFTLPRGASVTDFTMWVEGRAVRGQVLDRDEARRAYESLVRRARDPGLLEQSGDRTFHARVFPVAPLSEQRFEIEYFERLTCEAGTVRYVYPLRAPPAALTEGRATPTLAFRLDVASAVPIREVTATARAVEARRTGPGTAIAGFEGPIALAAAGGIDVRIALARPATGVDLVVHRPPGEAAGYFLLAITPGTDVEAAEILPKDVIFVIDTSGSMAGVKIEQARTALRAAIAALREGDRFNIIRFSSSTEPWRPAPVTATAAARADATAFVTALEASGSTAFDEALTAALAHAPEAGRPCLVLILTDGLPTTGETDPAKLLARAKAGGAAGARIFTFGVGDDVDARLLGAISEETRAVAETVAPDEAIDLKLAALARKIDAPVLAGLDLDLAALEAYDVLPRRLPDLFAGTQLIVTGRTKRAGDAVVRLRGTARGGRFVEIASSVTIPAERAADPEIARLFAMRKVASLIDAAGGQPLAGEVKDEVVALGKRFRLATPYTSFFVPEPKREVSDARLGQGMHGLPAELPRHLGEDLPQFEMSDHNETADGQDFGQMKGDAYEFLSAGPRTVGAPSNDAMGVGGGGGSAGVHGARMGGGRANLVRSAGGSQATESAVLGGLRWLARHQGADGGWHAEKFDLGCAPGTPCDGHGDPRLDVGLTGLSLLAFLGAGYTHLSRETYEDAYTHEKVSFGQCVKRAIGFLQHAQDADGCFGARDGDFMLEHAVATLAMCEAYGMTNAAAFRGPAQLGLDFILLAQNPYRGWGGTVKPGSSDTATTGACVMALKSAGIAGLTAPRYSYDCALAWLDAATDEQGAIGYDGRGKPVPAPKGTEAWAPHPSMTAMGLLARLWIEKVKSPGLDASAKIVAADPPRWDESAPARPIDYAYWFAGSIALYQYEDPSGPAWRGWNDALKSALLPHERTRKDGCADGSWDPAPNRWGAAGGRVYATAINVLTLEIYYRYDRVLKR